MELDSPFAAFAKSTNTEVKSELVEDKNKIEEALADTVEAIVVYSDEVKPNKDLETVTRILAEHDGKESDIALNCYEYWSSKRRL